MSKETSLSTEEMLLRKRPDLSAWSIPKFCQASWCGA